MKHYFIQVLVFLLVFQSQVVVASGSLACSGIHSSRATELLSPRVQISTAEGTEAQMFFKEKPFSKNRDQSLLDLLGMLAVTRQFRVVDGDAIEQKKGEFTLGLDISPGYRIFVKYRSEEQGLTFVAKSVTLQTPSYQEIVLVSKLLDLNEMKIRPDNAVSLKDFFSEGLQFHVALPVEIRGTLLNDFKGLLSRLQEFDSVEVKQLVQAGNLSKLKWLGHVRLFKTWAKRILTKKIFTKTIEYGLIFALVTHLNSPVQSHLKNAEPPLMPRATAAWVLESNLALEMEMKKADSQEVLALGALIKSELRKKVELNSLKIDLPRSKMKLSDGRFVWLLTSQANQGTYFVFSRDQGASSIEYTSFEVDPKKFPKIIEHFKSSGYVVDI